MLGGVHLVGWQTERKRGATVGNRRLLLQPGAGTGFAALLGCDTPSSVPCTVPCAQPTHTTG